MIDFIINLILAYFMGIVMFYVGIFLLAGIVFIFIKIYDFFIYLKDLIFDFIKSSFIFLTSHLFEISTILSSIFILLIIYQILSKRKERIKNKLTFFLKKSKFKLIAINNKLQPIIKPIKEWNDRHKPKDIKSMKKYGLISLVVGLFGAIIFYSSGLWYIALFYCFYIISGIYEVLFPQKALKQFYK
ncbi:hypothetical protein JCM11957_04140 [Caminibacter profundus]